MTAATEPRPRWYRDSPAGQRDEAEREAKRLDLHDRLVAEKVAVLAEAAVLREALEKAVGATESKVEKARVTFNAIAQEAQQAATALRNFERTTERRLNLLDAQARATCDPRVEAMAELIMDVVNALRMSRIDPPAGETGGECAMRLQTLALHELHERAALATCAEGVAILERVWGEVRASVAGSSRAYWFEKFDRVLDEPGNI